MIDISFDSKDYGSHGAIGILVSDQLKIDTETSRIDQNFGGLISNFLESKSAFKGKFGQMKILSAQDNKGEVKHLILVGIGTDSELTHSSLEEIGAKMQTAASSLIVDSMIVSMHCGYGKFTADECAALLASGALLSSYRFNKYHTKLSDEEKHVCQEFHVICNDELEVEKLFTKRKAVATGVFFARDLVSEVPNILYPESYAEQIVGKLEPIGIDVDVYGEREMRNFGMGALLGVGQGSSRESKMVVMRYMGADSKDEKPVCFVGKGVTFDTGGISLKPAANMHDMKYDMGGSAAVVGVMNTLALREAKVNAVGIVGLVENMPGGNAQRPGDVVVTMSGQTVEVLNTDAEGRLVLCDCLTYLQKNFKPACIVDLATLTGAILIALANTYAGCFSNDDTLSEQLLKAGGDSGEPLWRMPLHKDFDEMLKSTVADIANIGGERGMAGSSTAAHFLGRFIEDGIKWAHLDIAGMAWDKKGNKAVNPKGAVGFGVRLLNQFVQDNYESK